MKIQYNCLIKRPTHFEREKSSDIIVKDANTKKVMGNDELRFILACASGVSATLCVHPTDVWRIRLQLEKGKQSNVVGYAWRMLRSDGLWRGWYAGISAGVFRQLTYGGPRLALYSGLLESQREKQGKAPGITFRLGAGALAGGVASVLGCPAEVAMVRMIGAPSTDRFGVFTRLTTIVRREGIETLWSGLAPTVTRACVLNAAKLGVYSEAKRRLERTTELRGVGLQFCAALCSAIVGAAIAGPADVVKSRLQQNAGNTIASCIRTILRHDGPFGFWKGYAPTVLKEAPHAVISFVAFDTLTAHFLGREAM